MFVTIWMWTHEWSLISIRATAFTFDTCHQPFSCVSALTRSIRVRSLRLPRTGTLMRIRSTASAGVRRASCSASSDTGCSIRSAVSLSIAMERSIRPATGHGRIRDSMRTVDFDLTGIGGAAAALLAAGAVLPFLPGHPGLPCPLRMVTGIPCPFCGTTTSVEATLHAHPDAALAASPLGPALVAAAVVVVVRRPRHPLRVPLPVVVLVAAALWVFELYRFALI